MMIKIINIKTINRPSSERSDYVHVNFRKIFENFRFISVKTAKKEHLHVAWDLRVVLLTFKKIVSFVHPLLPTRNGKQKRHQKLKVASRLYEIDQATFPKMHNIAVAMTGQ